MTDARASHIKAETHELGTIEGVAVKVEVWSNGDVDLYIGNEILTLANLTEIAAFVEKHAAAEPDTTPASATVDLGPAEVVVNDVRYVREETLFAAMERHDRLRDALTRILRMGTAFDAKGQHSKRVFEIAEEALGG